MKKLFMAVAVIIVLLSGCKDKQPQTTVPSGNTAPTVSQDFAQTDDQMFTDRDSQMDYTESESVIITLNGDSVSCESAFVTVEGTNVWITGGGTFILRGSLNDGIVIVDAQQSDKPQLVLDGARITSSSSAALYIKEADKVFVTLVGENSLCNDGSFAAIDDSNIDGAVFSKQDLTFNGSGSLQVDSPAGHGIVCKDDLVFTGGTYTVAAASHGLDANDSVRFRGAEMTIDTGKDGIHVENSEDASKGFLYLSDGNLNIEAEGDGVDAGAYLQIEGGTVNILSGGGYENGESHNSGGWGDHMGGGPGGPGGPGGMRPRTATATEEASTSMKGLKSGKDLLMNGGRITIDSADDGIHSNASAVINGGTVQIASGDDGIHAEQTLTITNGTIGITQSYEGLEALNIHITGGNIDLVATDDGLNAAGGTDSSGTGGRDEMFGRPGGMGGASNGSIIIDGGSLGIQASGDGIDANGFLEIHGGDTIVCGPNMGDTATLDYDSYASITGGTFIGTGAAGMAQTFSSHEQGVLAVSVGQGQSVGVKITVSDKVGKELLSYTPELPFSVINFSSPELISGESYHITVGTQEGDLTAD